MNLEDSAPEKDSDCSLAALDFVHKLLHREISWEQSLERLAQAFDAGYAGWLLHQSNPGAFWQKDGWAERPPFTSKILEETRSHGSAVCRTPQSSWLLCHACVEGDWFLILGSDATREWTGEEKSALQLAAQALVHIARKPGGPFAEMFYVARLQQHLTQATRITARLAHDFGNILQGVLGFSELAIAQVPGGSLLHRYLQEVFDSAKHGAGWVQKLQMFSRRSPASPPASSVVQAIGEEQQRVKASWNRSVVLAVSLPPALPSVACEENLLRQMLGCLLDNAREAIADQGLVTLTARSVELTQNDCNQLLGWAEPGRFVEITVTDTGDGMKSDQQNQLFWSLFQSAKGKRRGLGLLMVYGLVYSHRGGLKIGPHPEQGTTVRVFLPEVTDGAEAGAAGDGPAILVVDDEAPILQLISQTLESAQMRVRGTIDPKEAVRWFQETDVPFRLVITDVSMPPSSGFELARRMLSLRPEARFLFVSSQENADPLWQRFPHLKKPFSPEALLNAVRSSLGTDSPLASAPR